MHPISILSMILSKNEEMVAIGGGGQSSVYYDDNFQIASGPSILSIYNLVTKKEIIINEQKMPVLAMSFSIGTDQLLVGDSWGFLSMYNTNNGSSIWSNHFGSSISKICFLPDDKSSVCGNENGDIYIVDTQTGKVIKKLRGHTNAILSLFFSADGKCLFSCSDDNTIKLWDIECGIELATFLIVDESDWMIYTSDGLFDASPGAMKQMYYVAGMETIDLEQLKHRYYQPGLLPILLGYSNEKLREVPPFDYVRLFPKKELKIENVQLKIDLKNQGGGIGKVSVFIDNIEIIKDARPGRDTDSSRYEMSISLDLNSYARYYRYDTTNVIKVVAWNAEGYLSSRPDTIHYIPSSKTAKGVEIVIPERSSSKPHLYGLVVGTSDYAGSLIDLQYAAKDATAFHGALTLGANRLFGEENVSVSLLSTEIPGQEPTLDHIFKQLMDMRKASPDDIVVVYFSGHGVNYGGQDGEFYYLTMTADGADAAYLNDPMVRKYRTISSQDLAFELNQIPARKKVLILDACSSGQAANNLLASLKDIPSSQKRALEFTQDATGSFILASSAANSVSYETSLYGQGLLTYALLKGMRGGQLKKIEEGEFVDVEKLLQYAKSEVPSLAKSVSGIQEPIYRNPAGTSFYIGQMTEEDKEKIQLAEPLPVFIPCKFINLNLEEQEIGIEELLNAKLDQFANQKSGSRIQFVHATDYPDAYQITGSYSRKGNEIEVSFIVKRGSEKITNLRKEHGTVDDLQQLIAKITDQIFKDIFE